MHTLYTMLSALLLETSIRYFLVYNLVPLRGDEGDGGEEKESLYQKAGADAAEKIWLINAPT